MRRISLPLLLSSAHQATSLQQIQLATQASESGGRPELQLYMMKDKGLKHDGAVCLDGSDAGFYFSPATDSKNKHDWQIVFEGGAWCFQEKDCVERAHGPLGSLKYMHTQEWGSRKLDGLLSNDCDVNPDFCNFNRVIVPYCDGTSFTGNRDEPVVSETQDGEPFTLYFRGARIRDALLDTLLTMGLDKAERVMVSGYSAGGLSAFLHTDYIHERLMTAAPKLNTFRAVPLSGFFLHHESLDQGGAVFSQELFNMVRMANSTGALDDECVADWGKDKWKCVLGSIAYKYVNAPTFVMNSNLDQWQTSFIMTGKLPEAFPATPVHPFMHCCDGWISCFQSARFSGCSAKQGEDLKTYQRDFNELLTISQKKHGDGAFVHSCPLHVEALDPEWSTLKVNGLTMQEALSKWWNSDEGAPTADHTTMDCDLNDASPYQCNPTCPDSQ